MALADLFSNSLISPVLNWAKQQNIPEAAGSLLAAYAIPAIEEYVEAMENQTTFSAAVMCYDQRDH